MDDFVEDAKEFLPNQDGAVSKYSADAHAEEGQKKNNRRSDNSEAQRLLIALVLGLSWVVFGVGLGIGGTTDCLAHTTSSFGKFPSVHCNVIAGQCGGDFLLRIVQNHPVNGKRPLNLYNTPMTLQQVEEMSVDATYALQLGQMSSGSTRGAEGYYQVRGPWRGGIGWGRGGGIGCVERRRPNHLLMISTLTISTGICRLLPDVFIRYSDRSPHLLQVEPYLRC